MTMVAPVVNIVEAVLNPEGRFATLEDIYAPLGGNGEPLFSVSDGIVSIEMVHRDKRCRLLCACSEVGEQRLKEVRRVSDRLLCRPLVSLAAVSYHPRELYVFDSTGQGSHVDVVVQEIPAGERLDNYILQYTAAGETGPVRRLLPTLAAMAEELAAEGIVHNNIKPYNIIVAGDGRLTLTCGATVRLADSEGSEVDNDNIALALIAAVTFIAACRPDLYTELQRRKVFMLVGFCRIATRVRNIAATHDIAPLYQLCNSLLRRKRQLLGRGMLNSTLRALADTAPQPLAEFSVLVPAGGADSRAVGEETENKPAPLCRPEGDKWCYVLADGAPVFTGASESAFEGEFDKMYDYAEDFFGGRAVVAVGEDFGLIDLRGGPVLPTVFEEVRWYPNEQVIIAIYEGRSMLYDRMGGRIGHGEWEWLGDVEEGLIAASSDGRYGYITANGLTAIDFHFDDAYDFRGGEAIVEIDGREMRIDRHGKILGR